MGGGASTPAQAQSEIIEISTSAATPKLQSEAKIADKDTEDRNIVSLGVERAEDKHELTSNDEADNKLEEQQSNQPIQYPYTDRNLFLDEEDGEEGDDLSDGGRRQHENRESWNMVTNSLEMDNEELLFNMLYFSQDGEEDINEESIGTAINNVMHETVALHSESNTPYKLQPASESDLSALQPETLDFCENYQDIDHKSSQKSDCFGSTRQSTDDLECAVCKEEFEKDIKVITLPQCRHRFHADCLFKWFKLQDWCPICRTPLSTSVSTTEDYNVLETGGKQTSPIGGISKEKKME